jgi:hypothetical protein
MLAVLIVPPSLPVCFDDWGISPVQPARGSRDIAKRLCGQPQRAALPRGRPQSRLADAIAFGKMRPARRSFRLRLLPILAVLIVRPSLPLRSVGRSLIALRVVGFLSGFFRFRSTVSIKQPTCSAIPFDALHFLQPTVRFAHSRPVSCDVRDHINADAGWAAIARSLSAERTARPMSFVVCRVPAVCCLFGLRPTRPLAATFGLVLRPSLPVRCVGR